MRTRGRADPWFVVRGNYKNELISITKSTHLTTNFDESTRLDDGDFKRTGPCDETVLTEAPCQSRYGTINDPSQLEDLSTEQSFTGNEDVPMSEIFSRG